MREMVDSLSLQPGQTISRKQVIDWFGENYPKIKTGTITAHLTRLSTNAPSRTHYGAKPEEDDVFFQIDGSSFRLYEPTSDPPPIRADDNDSDPDPDPDTDSSRGAAEFAYESDLRNYLSKNLTIIESALRLYEDEGINGIEFPVGGRFVDILALDGDNNLVVVELKVSRGYDRVVGQTMRYMAWIKAHQAEPEQAVRGVIVARNISSDLILACSLLPNVQLFEYQLSLTLRQIHPTGNDETTVNGVAH